MTPSDSEILEKIRGGAKHHYARLVDRYKDRAFTLAVRMLKNREDAEEAIQDAFIRAYNGLERFEGNAKFSTWFYRIVYNVCLTRLGKRKDDFIRIDYEDDEGYNLHDPALFSSTENDIESRDMIALVKQTIESLPEKYASVLSLFYFQELSHGEICEITQLPLGTVKIHLFRARALLQKRLHHELHAEKVTA